MWVCDTETDYLASEENSLPHGIRTPVFLAKESMSRACWITCCNYAIFGNVSGCLFDSREVSYTR